MNRSERCVFALGSSRNFGEQVGRSLGVPLCAHEERDFEDGEHKSRPLISVRGKDVYVIQSLFSDPEQSVNDKLCRLLFFIAALKDASAESVTAVVPYLCYARKDRKTQSRDPVTTRYVAGLFESVGIDRVVTIDVHNLAAFQNAFRCRTEHLEARKLFIGYFAGLLRDEETVVISPDVGGMKRAEQFRRSLSGTLEKEVAAAFMEKQRAKGIVSGDTLVGEVRGKVALIIDDLISTGTTIARTVDAVRNLGATKVYAAATHGIFVGDANRILASPGLDQVVITDSIPPFRLAPAILADKVTVLSAAPLFANAIERMHLGQSIVELMEI
jgi:ribose-phosphate pyrophosphokinase